MMGNAGWGEFADCEYWIKETGRVGGFDLAPGFGLSTVIPGIGSCCCAAAVYVCIYENSSLIMSGNPLILLSINVF